MDPVTQTNVSDANNSNTNTTTTPPTDSTNTVIAGAFGGTLPTPPQVSETMPAFSFDEDDFGSTNSTNPSPIPEHETIIDPFAGGVESLQQNQTPTSPTIESIVVDAEPSTEALQEPIIPEGTISLDSLAESTNTTIPQDMTYPENSEPDQTNKVQPTISETTIDEVSSTTPDSTINEVEHNTSPIEEVASNDISFDLPGDTNEDIQVDTTTSKEEFVTPTTQDETQTDTTQESSFDLPTQEIASNDMSFDLPGDTSEDIPVDTTTSTEEFVTPTTQDSATDNLSPTSEEDTTEHTDETTEDAIITEEEQVIGEDEDIPTQSVGESRQESTHDLQEAFEEFKQAFDNYSIFKNSTSLTLTGLRTEEEEINYTFNQENDNIIKINKSNTSDILSFKQTESGIKVMINADLIGYYGVDQVDSDTTHYLKEKLGKFTMMLTSEHEREEKKQRESIKKIKDTLKSF